MTRNSPVFRETLLVLIAVFLGACSGSPTTTWTPVSDPSPVPTATLALSPTATMLPSSPVPTVETVATPTEVPSFASPLQSTPTAEATASAGPAPVYSYVVVAEYPHDPEAWTQGLIFQDGRLIEGTGLRGESTLREVDLETGEVLRSLALPAEYFGEGITLLDDRIFQITWQENTGLVYDADTFELLRTWSYPTEGWGLTHDGSRLIMSDGTATLYFLDPETLETVAEVTVNDGGVPVPRLNELEYVDGEVWANVWLTDWIVRIDPDSGSVLGWIDMGGLLWPRGSNEQVKILNGIAYDTASSRLFVTGKWWPTLFEIEVVGP